MFKQRAVALALAVAAVTGITSGCEFKTGNLTGSPQAAETRVPQKALPTATPTAPAQRAGAPTGRFSTSEVAKETDDAVETVNKYWTDHWPDFFTGTYRSPEVKGFYDGDDPRRFTCGGKRGEKFNAFYCNPEDYLAWDFDLMKAGYAQGDAFVYLVVAHEWGHAIQNRLKTRLVSVDLELQADCLAGAVLWGARQDGTLKWEEGDTTEIRQSLAALADDSPWTEPSSHGDATERIGAFVRGRTKGVPGCLAKKIS